MGFEVPHDAEPVPRTVRIGASVVKLALFDLDNTLLSGDSDFEWAQFLIGKDVLDREVYEARNLEFLEAYRAGTLDIHAFLDFQLKHRVARTGICLIPAKAHFNSIWIAFNIIGVSRKIRAVKINIKNTSSWVKRPKTGGLSF